MTIALNQADFVIEIEQEVLGSLMLGGFSRVASMLEARHFIEPVHQHIYQAIASAHERFNSARPDILVKLLPQVVAETHEQSTGQGISHYLARLATSSVLGSANIEKSAKQVIEQSARLALADQAESLSAAARDPNSNPAELVTKAGVIFDDIVSDLRRGSKRKSQVSVSHAASNAIIAAEIAMATGTGITGLSWGLSDINHVTGGIHKRDLTLIGARPSMGKTSVAMSVGCTLAKQGHGVGFISLEMDAEKLAARAVSDLAYDDNIRIPYQDLVTGRLSQPDLYALKRVQKEMDGLPLLIEEQSGLSISDIPSASAICLLVFPSAISSRTDCCLWLSIEPLATVPAWSVTRMVISPSRAALRAWAISLGGNALLMKALAPDAITPSMVARSSAIETTAMMEVGNSSLSFGSSSMMLALA